MTNREQLKKKGFFVLKNLLSKDEVAKYRQDLETLSGITAENFWQYEAEKATLGGKKNYMLFTGPNGLVKHESLWDIVHHPKLLSAVREVLGNDIRFLQHNDTHVGFSASTWHRDSAHRTFKEGPDWEEDEPYLNVRVGFYLQSEAESHFSLGFLPGTHRYESPLTKWERRSERFSRIKTIFLGQKLLTKRAEWVKAELGDAIVFDPRTIHAGSFIIGPKYSIFTAYGIENKHFWNHYDYYQNVRKDLNYEPLPGAFAKMLKEHDLFPEKYPVKVAEK